MSDNDARTHFADVLDLVQETQEPIVVERQGKPLAVVISPSQYEVMARELGRAWASIEALQARNADRDPDEVLREVTSVVEEVRRERYDERRKPFPAPSLTPIYSSAP